MNTEPFLEAARELRGRFFSLIDSLSALRGLTSIDIHHRPEHDLLRNALDVLLRHQDLERCSIFLKRGEHLECPVEEARDLYRGHGVSELVVRDEALNAFVFTTGEQRQLQAEKVNAVDTTGAGDAFNAGYLAQRLDGADIARALAAAQALAARVVRHHGAILPG